MAAQIAQSRRSRVSCLLKRRFFNHPFWMEKRVYSKAEAWLDLIQTVSRFEETETSQLMAGNRIVSWKRGQVPAAIQVSG
jgi:hypothetical protein